MRNLKKGGGEVDKVLFLVVGLVGGVIMASLDRALGFDDSGIPAWKQAVHRFSWIALGGLGAYVIL